MNEPSDPWLAPFGHDYKVTCPEGRVACGVCLSDKHRHCNGNYNQLKCCEASPFSTDGNWVYQFQVATTTSNTLHWGMDKTESYTETSQWSDSVTASANAAFKVGGVSVSNTFSVTYGTDYAYSWSVNESEDFQLSYSADQVGDAVWQWVTTVVDNNGLTSTPKSKEYALTASRAQPPKCFPGYAASDDSQACHDGGYLPGYEPSGGGRHLLRGGN